MRALTLGCCAALALAAPLALAQSQAGLNAKALGDLRAADRSLSQAYSRLLSEASPHGRERLRTAQRDWIRFRDSDCAARAGSRGGSFYPTSLRICLAASTNARTRTLKAELACPEGDLSCGGHKQD